VEWDGEYALLGDFFSVRRGHPEIGERVIGGYPLDDIRKVLETAKSTLWKMTDVIGQWVVVDITDEVVARFVKKGWTEERVIQLKAEGCRYSPNRDTLLGPLISSDDLDDEEEPARQTFTSGQVGWAASARSRDGIPARDDRAAPVGQQLDVRVEFVRAGQRQAVHAGGSVVLEL
jgi:hypothetical protein